MSVIHKRNSSMAWPCNKPGFTPDVDNDNTMMIQDEVTPEALARVAKVAECFLNRYMDQCWIENDKDGFTGWRWIKYGTRLNIVCAANRYKDIIVNGPRHYSNGMRAAIDALGGIKVLRAYAGEEYEQGFIDQYGTFHNRKEAMVIARASGQIMFTDRLPTDELYSEHLV